MNEQAKPIAIDVPGRMHYGRPRQFVTDFAWIWTAMQPYWFALSFCQYLIRVAKTTVSLDRHRNNRHGQIVQLQRALDEQV